MSVWIVVPARWGSRRFEGKPLAPLRGAGGDTKTLIHRCWEAALAAPADRVVVATDDDRIAAEAAGFGAEVAMTSAAARNGTERVAEALAVLGGAPEIVVNLQGDAPLTPPWFLAALADHLRASPGADVATPVLRSDGAHLARLRADRAAGRVGGTTAVRAADGRALYFSKEVLPFGAAAAAPDAPTEVWHHVGVYAYRPAALAAYAALPEGALERAEGLEQLRFLEHGLRVDAVEVDGRGRAFWEVNNPVDIPLVEGMLAQLGIR